MGRFEDHGDRARRPGIACCFFVRSASADGSPPSYWWHPERLSLRKLAGGKDGKLGIVPTFPPAD